MALDFKLINTNNITDFVSIIPAKKYLTCFNFSIIDPRQGKYGLIITVQHQSENGQLKIMLPDISIS